MTQNLSSVSTWKQGLAGAVSHKERTERARERQREKHTHTHKESHTHTHSHATDKHKHTLKLHGVAEDIYTADKVLIALCSEQG